MDSLKMTFNKIAGGMKLRKDQLLIMVLSGVLLCVIAMPVREPDSALGGNKTDISDTGSAILGKNRPLQADREEAASADIGSDQALYDGDDLSYTAYWEEKLKQSLSRIEGAGEVEVLITLKESETRILEKDIPEETKETVETDAEGGSRTVTERQQAESTIYTVNEAGQNVPYVSKVIQPVVEGVVVIAQGADSVIVKQNIIETIQVLFAIDTNKIRVVKMKTNNN